MTDNEKLQNRALGVIIAIGLVVLLNLDPQRAKECREMATPVLDALEAAEKEGN